MVMVVIVPVLVVRAVIRVSTAVASLVTVEVLNILTMMVCVEVLAARRILAVPAIVAIVVVIHVSPEMSWTTVPGPRAHKDAA